MIAVTGATGHVGNVLSRALRSKGEQVRALILPNEDTSSLKGLNVEYAQGDICRPETLDGWVKGARDVYHLAGAISILPGQMEMLEKVNVNGTKNVVDACLRNKVRRLVYTSSIHAVREAPHGTATDERMPFDPVNVLGDYAKSKALASLEVVSGIGKGLDAVIVCPTGIIGPFDFRISEMGRMFVNFASGKLKARIDGAYDFVDVRDVAAGHVLACEKGRTGETYILSGEQITVNEIFQTLEQSTGVSAPALNVPAWAARLAGRVVPVYCRMTNTKPLFTTYSVDVLLSNSLVSSNKARAELGFSPRPVRESIADAVKWFKENRYC